MIIALLCSAIIVIIIIHHHHHYYLNLHYIIIITIITILISSSISHDSLLTGSNVEFIFDHGFNPTPGWQLTDVWLTPEGMPKKGLLSFEFFAGDGMNMNGCLLDRELRGRVSALTLVTHRDLSVEYDLNPLTYQESKATAAAAALKGSNTTAISLTPVIATKTSKFRRKIIPVAEPSSTDEIKSLIKPPVTINTIAMQFSLGPSMKCLVTQLPLLSKQFMKKKIKNSSSSTSSSSSNSVTMDAKRSRVYTYLDADDHLRTTQVTWNYEDGDYGRVESWKLT